MQECKSRIIGETKAMACTDATPEGFESWLTDHLNRLQLDGEVYAGYIHGTLLTTDDDFTVEDVEKYVLDVVSGFIVSV